MKLVPGEKISAITRVLEEPEKAEIDDRVLIVAKISNGEKTVNLVAWDTEAAKWNLKKNDIIEIIDGVCPKTHKKTHQPPTIEIIADTTVKKVDMVFPSINECMRKNFLENILDYEYVIAEGFIVQVHSTAAYFCNKCNKFSDRMCECGSFPKPIFKIEGMFSDGTQTLEFTTVSERIAEYLSYHKKTDASNIKPYELMNKAYKIIGYIRNQKLYIEEVLA